MHFVFVACLALLCTCCVMAADMDLEHGQIKVNIMEKSGKMTITAMKSKDDDDSSEGGDGDDDDDDDDDDVTTVATETTTVTTTTTTTAPQVRRRRAAGDDDKDADNVVTVKFHSLIEVNAEGTEVGKERTMKQKLDSFDEAMVTFSADGVKDDSTLKFSKNAEDKEIKAKELEYSLDLGGDGKLTVVVYIAAEAGNITTDGETTPVTAGMVKFTVKLEGWVWCVANGECAAEEVGAFLDLKLSVTGDGEAAKQEAVDGMAMEYAIGKGNTLYMSKKFMSTDGDTDTWLTMADEYPKAENGENSMTAMTLRFPNFVDSVWYDPSVKMTIPGSDGVSAASNVAISLAAIVMGVLTALFNI